ncbi:hypothetical protein AAG906_012658 [Vitis piasezkii]
MGRPLKEVGFCSGPSDSPVLSRDAVITQGEGLDLRTDGDPLQVKLRDSPGLISEEDMRLALELRTPDASEALSPGATNDALMEEAARFPAAGPLVCWEDPGGFSVDGDVLEPGPWRIVQLDVKAFLRSQRADVVCLQETKKQAHVGFGSEKSGISVWVQRLVRNWWTGYNVRGSCSHILASKLKALNRIGFWKGKEKDCGLSSKESEARRCAEEDFSKWADMEEISWRQNSREL